VAVRAFELIGTVEVNTGKAQSELNQLDSTVSRVGKKIESSGLFSSALSAGAMLGVAGLTFELGRGARAILDYSARSSSQRSRSPPCSAVLMLPLLTSKNFNNSL
jgi:hypothetical protein